MPKGMFPRKPKDVTTSQILRENQQLRIQNGVLQRRLAHAEAEVAKERLAAAQAQYDLATLKKTIAEKQ